MNLRLAHTAIRVPDIDAAARWYESVLGLRVLSPPFLMDGASIARDMGELLPDPPAIKAAIIGTEEGDHVLELIEYPRVAVGSAPDSITHHGLTHVGLVCVDVDAVRNRLAAHGAEFLTRGVADVARLRTTWFRDPWGVVFILVEKSRPARPYYAQWSESSE